MTDDQRFGTLRLPDPTTGEPWMANTVKWFGGTTNAEGAPVSTEFTTAFPTTPICCPARASLITGQYAHNNGVLRNVDADKLDETTTLQYYLKSQSPAYYTGIFGKYLNDWVTLGGDPPRNPRYFDEWTVWDNGVHFASTPAPPRPDPPHLRGVDCINDQGRLIQIPPDAYETTYLVDKATDFIRRRAADPDTPWYLYLAPTSPHSPFHPEEQYANRDVPGAELNASNSPEADVTDKPFYVQNQRRKAEAFLRSDRLTWPRDGRCLTVSTDGLQGYTECVLERIRPAQLRMLKSVDDMVERVFTTLEQTNQADDTLAFFTTDHGFLWNEHGLQAKAYPYYDMRIPLHMRWPHGNLTTTRDSSLVANIDLAPTVLAATGVSIPPDVDGQDLLAPDRRPRERLLIELDPYWLSLVKPELQYTEYYTGDAPLLWSDEYPARADSPPGTPVREYYDLVADPLQLRNLLHDGDLVDHPSEDVLEAIRGQLVDDRNCAGRGGVPGRPACP